MNKKNRSIVVIQKKFK